MVTRTRSVHYLIVQQQQQQKRMIKVRTKHFIFIQL